MASTLLLRRSSLQPIFAPKIRPLHFPQSGCSPARAKTIAPKGKPAMSEAILVTYATRGGSTREVADAVAATLRTQGLKVEVRPVESVDSILPYSAVVVGAPIYYGHWHKDMLRFLAQHTVALITRPVAFFALGPVQPDEEEMKSAKVVLDKELAQFQWLAPVAGEVFVGRYDSATLNPFERLLLKLPGSPLHKLSITDQRDWAAICAWAESLATTLKPLVAANA